MAAETRTYLWQLPEWPHWRYDLDALATPLTEVAMAQGKLFGALSQSASSAMPIGANLRM